jgi:hypothetical protein
VSNDYRRDRELSSCPWARAAIPVFQEWVSRYFGARQKRKMTKAPKKWPAALPLLMALISNASANTFRLECLDAYDSKRRLALIEINTDAVTVRVYSESEREWKAAVNVAISDATFSFVEHEFSDLTSPGTSVTINRASGKYFAYTAHSARQDGRCRKAE